LHNGFGILKGDFYNYAPAYMVLLAFATLLPVKSLYAIKLLSLPVVPLAGYFMARMIGTIDQDTLKTWLAYTLTILAPTYLLILLIVDRQMFFTGLPAWLVYPI
jgi:hypothetical protein